MVKHVVNNNNGGTKTEADCTLAAAGPTKCAAIGESASHRRIYRLFTIHVNVCRAVAFASDAVTTTW